MHSKDGDDLEELKRKYRPFVRTDRYGLTGRQGPTFTLAEKIRIFRRLGAYTIILVWYGLFLAFVTTFLSDRTARWAARRVTPPVVRLILYVLGFESIRRRGQRDPRAPVLVSNHTSYMDINILGEEFFPSFVSKESLKRAPIVGKLSILMNCIYVPEGGRTTGGSGTASEVISRIRLAASSGKQNGGSTSSQPVLVFPEGTTTNGEWLLPFRTGAFAAGLPVQPILIQYNHEIFNPSYEAIPFKTHVVRMVAQPVNTCTVTLLPVVDPPKELTQSIEKGENMSSEAQRAAARRFADDVRGKIADAGKLSLSDLTFQDKLDYKRALKDRGYK